MLQEKEIQYGASGKEIGTYIQSMYVQINSLYISFIINYTNNNSIGFILNAPWYSEEENSSEYF